MNLSEIFGVPGPLLAVGLDASTWLGALLAFGILTLWIPSYWPVSVFQTGSFALAGVAIWRARSEGLRLRWPILPLSFAVVWGVIQWSTRHTAYAYETRLAILKWATFLSVFLSGTIFLRDTHVRQRFRSAVLWFGSFIAILATLQTFTSQGKVFWLFPTRYTDSVMGPMLSRNDFAAFIEVILPIALYQAVRREREGWLYSALSALLYASVIASASRAGTVLATAEVLLVPLLLWVRRGAPGRTSVAALAQVLLLVTAFAAVVGVGPLWTRFQDKDPMAGRREFAVATWHMAVSHPWTGTGLGTWATVYPAYAVVDLDASVNQAHDDWLQWVAEGGFPFGIVLATLLLWSVRPAFRSVWGVGVVAVFLHALVDYPFAKPALGAWPLLIAAMLSAEHRKHDEISDPPLPNGRGSDGSESPGRSLTSSLTCPTNKKQSD